MFVGVFMILVIVFNDMKSAAVHIEMDVSGSYE